MRRCRWYVAVAAAATVAGWQALGIAGGLAAQEQSTWSGVYTSAQASRGESVYNSGCAVCHGDDLAGSEMGPGLAGSSFLNFWDGLSLGDLYQVMSVSMPQDNPGSLETTEYVDVIAYMLQESEFPTGDAELSEEALGGITIQAQAQ
jgi:quinoprotein glucose dehydrogenase